MDREAWVAGNRPENHKESDMAEAASHACTGRIFYGAVSIVADVFVR